MKKVVVKQKRHRRTKKEMEAFRKGQLDALIVEAGKDKGKDKKSSEKSNLEELDYVYDVATKVLSGPTISKVSCIPKPRVEPKFVEQAEGRIIEGWVNVYKHAGQYWLGSDIHLTIEDARKVSGAVKTKQIKFSFEEF